MALSLKDLQHVRVTPSGAPGPHQQDSEPWRWRKHGEYSSVKRVEAVDVPHFPDIYAKANKGLV